MGKKDYSEYVNWILDTDKEEIKELENGNFSNAKKLDYWMTYHHFEYIFAIIKGCLKNYDEKMLDYISLLATGLSNNIRLVSEEADLKSFIKYYCTYFLNCSDIDVSDNKLNSLTREELVNLLYLIIANICELIQLKIDEVKKLASNNSNFENLNNENMIHIDGFSIDDIDILFNNHRFNLILKGLSRNGNYIDFDILKFISYKAQNSMVSSVDDTVTNEELISEIKSSEMISPPWLDSMSREELIYEYNMMIARRCSDILIKVISICFKDLEKYGSILEVLCENAKHNKKLYLYLSDYLPDSELSKFSSFWNRIGNEDKGKINYIADALEYGAITNSIHSTIKTADMIESLIFKHGISSCDIPLSIRVAGDKRLLAYIILEYINEGFLTFDDSVKKQLPASFNYIKKPL